MADFVFSVIFVSVTLSNEITRVHEDDCALSCALAVFLCVEVLFGRRSCAVRREDGWVGGSEMGVGQVGPFKAGEGLCVLSPTFPFGKDQ